MGYTVKKITFPLYNQRGGPDKTKQILSNGRIPPIVNGSFETTITFRDILPDPYPNQRKDLVIEIINNDTQEIITKRFHEPTEGGNNRDIIVKLP